MKSYRLNFDPTAVRFSYSEELVVLVAGEIIGTDALKGHVLIQDFSGPECRIIESFTTDYNINDATWVRSMPDLILVAGGNGSVCFFNCNGDSDDDGQSSRSFPVHSRAVTSVDWNPSNDSFITTSINGNVQPWTMRGSRPTRQGQFWEHSLPVFSAKWNPQVADQFATVSADGMLRIWNSRDGRIVGAVAVESEEKSILSCDWNRTGQFIVTATLDDNHIKVWDTRNLTQPVEVFPEFHNARFLPHLDHGIVACSFDGWTVLRNYDRAEECETIPFPTENSGHAPVGGLDTGNISPMWFASAGLDWCVNLVEHHQNVVSNGSEPSSGIESGNEDGSKGHNGSGYDGGPSSVSK